MPHSQTQEDIVETPEYHANGFFAKGVDVLRPVFVHEKIELTRSTA